MKKYEKPSIVTFDEKTVLMESEVKVSAPPPSAWSCVRG